MTRPRTPPAQSELVANARGLALAAFLPASSIARLLGCAEGDATAFQQNAVADFHGLMFAVSRAKGMAQ